jgi:hypothetical protein
METSISIIDKRGSKVSTEANVRLLWTAILIGETVNSSCEPTIPLYIALDYDTFPEKAKFPIYLDMLKNNPQTTEEVVQKVQEYYSKIVHSRHMRGKNKEHIVLVMKGEKWLNACF